MIDHFAQFIHKHRLCLRSDKILLAISGGVDSVVMLNLFIKSGYSVGIAHCNFGLRGKESDDDEAFVRRLAEELGIPVYIKKFETEKYAEQQRISIQMAARDLRYAWFEKIRVQKGYMYVATAHNINDSVETIIFNLAKGTGLKGLTGIPVRTSHIIRPLLFAAREQIAFYAEKNQINFREDSSNTSIKYQRNYIRHKILPEFEKINPGFFDTVKNTIDRLGGLQSVLGKWLDESHSDYFEKKEEDIYLKKDFFNKFNEPALLYEVIGAYGFNYDQCISIFENLNAGSGSIFYSEKYVLNNDRAHLIISRKEYQKELYMIQATDKFVFTNRFKLELEYVGKSKEEINPGRRIGYFDVDKLQFPLELRSWANGDWFIPIGMKGKKKLSDFMIDKKIPLNLKNRILVLLSGDSIAWIAGYRIDDRFKIEDDTKKLLKITYLELDD
jgi:tRNA(Ile)-lysidine synthase